MNGRATASSVRPGCSAPPPATAGPVGPAAAGVAYRRLPVEQRRAQLLAAALGLFAHRAPEDVSPDDVAQEAGVSRPLVYRYFPGGKQQLYEAALRTAADQLELCFTEEQSGPLSRRLSRALDRYLAFVDQHDTGFSALLRGGSVVETSRTSAMVDEVRRTAAEQVLLHLAAPEPGRRLRMMVRTWIAAVEAASLIWLDEAASGEERSRSRGERSRSRGELRDWLVDHFVALLLASAASDPECAEVAGRALASETPDGPVSRLLQGMAPAGSAPAVPPPAAPRG
ncbi:TetR/AcrR family transcriptional regulator [Streptomyces meridianus]|uniref:TetR/AcrR family transcriptional regulator n=1 Tax=Streptomyces meridianus TaxID=2938945 RepID=A0ABT0X1N3_9ACTN|nr:TetR/AcrR family transcriptional regulator [Streptomyces meridianus]MCM2576065.1 TetR/AcrR family transcriptional regulator [Streptomyces meridianus]